MKKAAVAAGALFIMSAAAMSAVAQDDFLNRFEGSWAGSGTVQRNLDSDTHNVKCKMAGTNVGQSVSIDWTCSAYLVFNREFGADITLNPQTGRYTGTYTGSKIGPASLSGTKDGNVIKLTITWPAEVNGDRTAQMRITNDGTGNLRISVLDRAGGEGPLQTTTDIALSKA
jgi:hypothetical protein